METKYPTLKRPKRKLCYLTNPDSPVKKWTGKLTLADVDNMFDDLDPPSSDDVDPAPSTLHQTSDNETNQSEKEVSPAQEEEPLSCPMGPGGDALNPSQRSPRHKQAMDSPVADVDIPFKGHGPIKTSSPIEENMVVERECGDLNREKDSVVSPILFTNEGEEEDEAQKEPVSCQKPQTNGHSTQKSDDFELESPPVTIALSKPKMSCRKKEVKGICKEGQPIEQTTPKKPGNGGLVDKRNKVSQENKDPPVPTVRQEPVLEVRNKKSENVHQKPTAEVSTRVGKDVIGFLQKLREAGQAKPTCSRKSQSPVKVPTPPPEPEDDFWILEDDTPLWISIPNKSATSKKQRQRRTSSADKNSSTEKEAKETMKGKEEKKNNVEAASRNETPEDSPAVELTEHEKLDQKAQLPKKIPLKGSNKAGEQPKDAAASHSGDGELLSLETKKKAQKRSEIRKEKVSKERKENIKRGRPKKVKETRGENDAGKKMVCAEAVEEPREESESPEEVGSQLDEEVVNPEAQAEMDTAEGNEEQNKAQPKFDGSSPKDDQILRTRGRKKHGPRWMSNQGEIEVTDSQPTAKKSKQNKDVDAATPSPIGAKKEKVLKRKGQKEAKEKNSNKRKPTRTRGKVKATEEAHEEMEAEPREEQDADRGEESSPLDLTQRDHSLKAGNQVFQRVYSSTSAEKQPITPVPASSREPREQLRAAESNRRQRKPPGNWWMVGSLTEEENVCTQPQPKEPKLQRERKKPSRLSKLGTPKNGNVAVSSKPQGGAPSPPLNVRPLSAPKTVKRSLATFKDIFTSNTETPTPLRKKGAGRTNTRKVSVGEPSIHDDGVGEVLSMEPEEVNSPPQLNSPLESSFPSVNSLKDHRSGPSSMIPLQEYEEDDCSALVSGARATLSASDLCAPPLKPLVLQPKDKANLTEWFNNLWSASLDKGPEITPDQFDWYFYQGRAFGFLVDLNCETLCNGKMLLGSYMKKPLWVDHSATSVFNLFTSSVSVTINGSESRYNPGQSFMVPCGQAYSIKNMLSQPAVLCFTRIYAESSD